MLAEQLAGGDLAAGALGLLGREQAGLGFAVDRAGEAEVRAVTGGGVGGAGAAGFGALDEALGEGAAAERLGVGQAVGQGGGRGGRGNGIGHIPILRHIQP